jgi:hypothetical protein
MNRLGRIDALGYGLIALCLALAATIMVELRGNAVTPPQETTTSPAAPTQTVIKSLPLASYAAVVQRPLFSDTRRPAPVETSAVRADAAVELRHLVLTGVLLVGPHDQLAILLDRSRGEQIRILKGGEITGWSLAEVRADGVTLRKGVVTYEMPLHEEKPPGSAGTEHTLPQRGKPQ